MRARYLYDLASICHVSPRTVDALTCSDFFQLLLGIDAHYANIKKQNEEMRNAN